MYRTHEQPTATAHSIIVEHLQKTYRVPVRQPGLVPALRSVVRREHRTVTAVSDVSFSTRPGEIVGFLGSNGAGKTTTLKMLTGLLQPTGGLARVAGYDPSRRQHALLRQIAMVMGQRSQLIWDLPAADSFQVQRAIYQIPRADFDRRVREFIDLLDIEQVVRKPVRNLSLGERMKCELAVALLHHPTVLFLDEPTIGLDTTMQRRIRSFLTRYNAETGATIMLTSHYMADVEELCERIIVIDGGRMVFDGTLDHLVRSYSTHQTLAVTFDCRSRMSHLHRLGQVVECNERRAVIRVERSCTPRVTAELLATGGIHDLSVGDPSVEDVIEQVYALASHTAPNEGGDSS